MVGRRAETLAWLLDCERLSGLLATGMPLNEASRLLGTTSSTCQRWGVDRRAMFWTCLAQQVSLGVTLSEALLTASNEASRRCPDSLVRWMAMGERGMQLPDVLDAWSLHQRRQLAWGERWVKAISYPVALVVLSWVMSAVLTQHVLPAVVRCYVEAGRTLPALTQTWLRVGAVLSSEALWWVGLGGLVGVFSWRRWGDATGRIGRWRAAIPWCGTTWAWWVGWQWLHGVQLGVQSGLALREALLEAADVVVPDTWRAACIAWSHALDEGVVWGHVQGYVFWLPQGLREGLRWVAEVEEPATALVVLCGDAERCLDQRVQATVAWVAPMLLCGVAAWVASLMMAVYEPMFRLGETL